METVALRRAPLPGRVQGALVALLLAPALGAWVLIEAVRSLDLGFLAWDGAGPYVAGAVILAAAGYQLTPMKDACLRRCREPDDGLDDHDWLT